MNRFVFCIDKLINPESFIRSLEMSVVEVHIFIIIFF